MKQIDNRTPKPRKTPKTTRARAGVEPAALPPSLPLPPLAQTLAFWRAPLPYLELCRRRYGDSFTVNALGKPPMVFLSDPADIGAVVAARPQALHPGAGAAVLTPLVGERSFMLLEEDEHLRVRRAVVPAFDSRAAARHADMVSGIVEREVARWPEHVNFAAHRELRALTLRVILAAIFGRADPRLDELHEHLLKMLAITASLALHQPHLRSVPPWADGWSAFLRRRAHVERLLDGLIEDEAHAGARDSGVLSLLISEHCGTSLRRVREDLMSVILAGHETTAAQLAWALQLLSHHPLSLATLTSEIDRGEETYLTATVQETMRHRPVFLFAIPRMVHTPVEIAGRRFVAPTQLVGCIYLMHHDPALFRTPQRFMPERFVESPPSPRTWLPWGGGRKRCPGHSLATLEMKTVLREVIKRWAVRPGGRTVEAARWRSVIVTPERGCRIVLGARTRHKVVSLSPTNRPRPLK